MSDNFDRLRVHTGDDDLVYSLREQVRALEKLDEQNKKTIAELSTALVNFRSSVLHGVVVFK